MFVVGQGGDRPEVDQLTTDKFKSHPNVLILSKILSKINIGTYKL